MSQLIGLIALQSNPSGQQMADFPLSKEIQLVPAVQQMFPGSRESTVEQDVAVELAHVKALASRTPSACAADRGDDRAMVEGTTIEIRYMRPSLCSIVFGDIVRLSLKVKLQLEIRKGVQQSFEFGSKLDQISRRRCRNKKGEERCRTKKLERRQRNLREDKEIKRANAYR